MERRMRSWTNPYVPGKRVLFCPYCDMNFITTPSTFRGVCPKCGRAVILHRCSDCGYIWENLKIMRILNRPCPRCGSRGWNRIKKH